jgi:predicted O-methyltransferase YrrM
VPCGAPAHVADNVRGAVEVPLLACAGAEEAIVDEQQLHGDDQPTGRDRPVGEARVVGRDVDDLAVAQLAEIGAAEDEAVSAARRRAGATAHLPSPPTGALLAWLARTLSVRSAVMVGSAHGVSGLYLLRGAGPRATLTAIERDPEVRELATEAFAGAGVTGSVRSIPGEPLDALPRLTDDGYDLVVVHSVGDDPELLLGEIRRVLRPGGVIVVVALADADRSELRRRRALVQALADDEAVSLAVLPFDAGVALATITGAAEDQ